MELLRLAGRAGVEVGSDDAVDRLRRVTELQPESAEAWRDLADALAAEGRTEEAERGVPQGARARARATRWRSPQLGHTAFQAGKRDDAVALLEQAAGARPAPRPPRSAWSRCTARSDQPARRWPRRAGSPRRTRRTRSPLLDVAELAVETGDLDEAAEAFGASAEILELPEEEVARCTA